jgi:hypothetical protein
MLPIPPKNSHGSKTNMYSNASLIVLREKKIRYINERGVPPEDLPLLVQRRVQKENNPYACKEYTDFVKKVAEMSGINRNLDSVYHFLKINYACVYTSLSPPLFFGGLKLTCLTNLNMYFFAGWGGVVGSLLNGDIVKCGRIETRPGSTVTTPIYGVSSQTVKGGWRLRISLDGLDVIYTTRILCVWNPKVNFQKKIPLLLSFL